jgi:hypothetical protein
MKDGHQLRMWCKGRVCESETGRLRGTNVTTNLARRRKKDYQTGKYKGSRMKVFQITSFREKENKNLALTQNFFMRLVN